MRRIRSLSHQHLLLVATSALVLLLASGCSSYDEPEWTSIAKSEGKSYATDGTIAIDTQVIEMAQPPPTQSASKWFSESMFQVARADASEQFSIDDLTASSGNPDIMTGPGGQQLEAKYVAYLSGKLSGHTVSFWQLAEMEPMVIVVDGKAAGALKPLN